MGRYEYLGLTHLTAQPFQLPLLGNHTVALTSAGSGAADRTLAVALLVHRG
ncbi:hypothetical protein ACFRAU_22225 [Arthrobacter sp. NPDC056691]|uniref:hypothetical protein n=1 Tax=Arthrobacter sp. NPDC056691 TaxID=3345913 RepID=UPI0036734069